MKKGFTLIELLVVVLIIGILAAVALPQYERAVQKSRNAQLKAAVRSTVAAQEVYKLANGEPASSFGDLDIDWGLEAPAVSAGNVGECAILVKGPDSVRRGKDFDVILNGLNIVAVWTSGKYKCTGFSYSEDQLLCMEAANGKASISNGDFCQKIENGSYQNARNSWRWYTLP